MYGTQYSVDATVEGQLGQQLPTTMINWRIWMLPGASQVSYIISIINCRLHLSVILCALRLYIQNHTEYIRFKRADNVYRSQPESKVVTAQLMQ